MAKTLLIVLGVLVFTIVPLIVLAQFPKARMSDCCLLKHDITVARVTSTPSIPALCRDAVNNIYRENCVISALAVNATCYSKNLPMIVNISDSDWGGVCTMDTVNTVTDFLFWLFLGISVIMGIWVGFMFMTAGGNPAQTERARGMIVYLVVGIAVAIAMRLIPSLARAIVGV